MVGRSIDPERDLNVHGLACLLLASLLLSDWLSAFTREQNLRDRPRGFSARPIPLQLTQQLDQACGLPTGLDDALEPRPVCLQRGATDGIHDRIDLVPLAQAVERGEGEARFRPQRGQDELLPARSLDTRAAFL